MLTILDGPLCIFKYVNIDIISTAKHFNQTFEINICQMYDKCLPKVFPKHLAPKGLAHVWHIFVKYFMSQMFGHNSV